MFHVSASGEVTTPSYPETLHVVKFERERNKNGEELPPAFIEVGVWTYPLMRGKSPILKSDYGESRYSLARSRSYFTGRRLHAP